MIPNDWERIRTNVRPFLGEAAHWHRWPCEGASDSPRHGRRGPHGGERMRMPKKKWKKNENQWKVWRIGSPLSHDSEISVTISDFNIAGKWQRLRVSVCKGSMMLKVETCFPTVHICSPPLFPTYSRKVFHPWCSHAECSQGSSWIFWDRML